MTKGNGTNGGGKIRGLFYWADKLMTARWRGAIIL
jgi:hypothetical protein